MVRRGLWLLVVTISLGSAADGYAITMTDGGWLFWLYVLVLPANMYLWVLAARNWIMWGLNHEG